jgi:RNA polymerase sigma-70 factor (ECF subfamily)
MTAGGDQLTAYSGVGSVGTGDAAFTEFVRARSAALLRTAYLLTGDRGLAEDLLQTVLAKTYVSWGRIREPAAAEGYVRKALVNTATTWWRSKRWRNEKPSGEAVPEGVVAARTDEVDERRELWALVQSLPTRQRAVVVLRFYEDLTEAETANILGCSIGTVKSQASRALGRLRGVLHETTADAGEES